MSENLEAKVYSEGAMLELLGIDRKALDALRYDKDFPTVKLSARARVYLADEVLAWLKERSTRT